MTAQEQAALSDIRGYASANRIEFTHHAYQRMAQRRVSVNDVGEALRNANDCRCNDGSWRVSGPDLDGENLRLIVVLEDGVVVVTVY